MPSGPKKRRAARRKQAKSHLDEASNDVVQNVVSSTESSALKELNDAVEDDVSKALMETEIMELLIGNMAKGSDVSVVPENESGNGDIQLACDEKDDEVGLNGKFVKLLELVEQIQDLVQGVRGLIVEQKDLI